MISPVKSYFFNNWRILQVKSRKKYHFHYPKFETDSLRDSVQNKYDVLILPTGEKHHLIFTESKSVIKVISVPVDHWPLHYKYCHLSADDPAQPGKSLCQRVSPWEKTSAYNISSRIKVCVEMVAAITPWVCCKLVSEGHQRLSDSAAAEWQSICKSLFSLIFQAKLYAKLTAHSSRAVPGYFASHGSHKHTSIWSIHKTTCTGSAHTGRATCRHILLDIKIQHKLLKNGESS